MHDSRPSILESSPSPQRQDLAVFTPDGYALGASVFEPARSRATVIVNGAMAVPQAYYGKFARYLARWGLRTITWDYRGVGRSTPPTLRGFSATATDWATLDAVAVRRYVAKRWPNEPVLLVGHSFGGQALGLSDELHDVAGAVLVASQLGYFGHWPVRDRFWLSAYWYGVVPLATWALGYWPGALGLGADLPAGVVREWAKWCRSPGYLTDHHPDARQRFARFTKPTVMFSFTDDWYAPPRAVEALVRALAGAPLEHRRIEPAAGKPIGHFGFFRPQHEAGLWMEARDHLLAMAAGRERALLRDPVWGFEQADVLGAQPSSG